MLDRLRDNLKRLLASRAGDAVPGVAAARRRLVALAVRLGVFAEPGAGADAAPRSASAAAAATPALAPVQIYATKDSPGRAEMEALLAKQGIPFRTLAVDEDEATLSWLRTSVKRQPPVVFIGGDPVGGLDELAALADSGELERRVFGAAGPRSGPAVPVDPERAAQIFGRSGDPWTQRAADLLAGKGVACERLELDDPRLAGVAEQLAHSTKQRAAPYVFVRGRFVGGFNALDELERLGKLDELLTPAAADEPNGRPRIRIEIAGAPPEDHP
jgi:glutaredoxin 3